MKVAIVFTSMTGNTEEIAEIIAKHLKASDITVDMFQINYDDIMASDLSNYQAILFGTYTWGDGDLPYEVEDFSDDLAEEDMSGKFVALFGSCDSYYPQYGTAIDRMAEQFQSIGATVIQPLLKVDLAPNEEDIERCEVFAKSFIEKIK
ncbi:flavodoxin I [Natronobacillus azotifigens]|uniref:Flavodoxin n=1 Tax=Natronobacillus azotifigens TaxID=472978 RepID=A0A9J6RBN7_9BACI|nr:flavodoxin [Natronobacillus azotifigens]MCZ0702747.1 flavodoxin [Natronobacillus azotifigens]